MGKYLGHDFHWISIVYLYTCKCLDRLLALYYKNKRKTSKFQSLNTENQKKYNRLVWFMVFKASFNNISVTGISW